MWMLYSKKINNNNKWYIYYCVNLKCFLYAISIFMCLLCELEILFPVEHFSKKKTKQIYFT